MSEIEVKILNIVPDIIKEKLISLGAKLVKKEFQVNYMFDYSDYLLHNKYKGFCRIREVNNQFDGSKKYILTIKKMISQADCKEMLEHETEVLSFESTKNILSELGLINYGAHKKIRESYELNDILYEIDTWDKELYPTPYLEVEAKDRESLKKGIELIGYKFEDTTSKTLAELREELKVQESKNI